MSSTMAFPVTFRPELKVTGSASLSGGGTVKMPADYVNTSDIVPASWVWKLIRRYGLAGGINTGAVSYLHLPAHQTKANYLLRPLLLKKKKD